MPLGAHALQRIWGEFYGAVGRDWSVQGGVGAGAYAGECRGADGKWFMRRWLALPMMVAVGAAGCAGGPGEPASGADRDPVVALVSPMGDAYYLATCPVCDGRLGYTRVALERVIGGRSLRFCSESCVEVFGADLRAGTARIDAIMIRDQVPHYPVRVSLVSGRPLGDHPIDTVWCNRLFRLADESERGVLLREPTKYLRALDAEVVRAQSPGYGMPDKCPVQGDILDDDTPLDIVLANRMIRVCCVRCARVVRARPYQYLGMVDHANKGASEAPGERP